VRSRGLSLRSMRPVRPACWTGARRACRAGRHAVGAVLAHDIEATVTDTLVAFEASTASPETAGTARVPEL